MGQGLTRVEREPDRVDILGVDVSAINLGDAVATIEAWIGERRRNYVCVTGAHGVIESRRDARLRQIHNAAGMVTPDGMPLVWLARLKGRRGTRRVYGPDLMEAMTAVSAERGYRQFYYGGAPGVGDRLALTLTRRHPKLAVAGVHCPPFGAQTEEEEAAAVAAINAAKPDIVWVGLSTPKQEMWMARQLGRIEAPAMIGVGAAFDFLSGTKRQAPLWMQRNGLEWLFRLACEPKRLGHRYAYVVPTFLMLAAASLARDAVARGAPAPRPAADGNSS